MKNKKEKAMNINGRMKVKTLKEQFKNEFGLTLRVYDGRQFANDDSTLASIRKTETKGGELTVRKNMKVGNFENKFFEDFGIKVQVAGSDNSYLANNDLTLAKALEADEKKLEKKTNKSKIDISKQENCKEINLDEDNSEAKLIVIEFDIEEDEEDTKRYSHGAIIKKLNEKEYLVVELPKDTESEGCGYKLNTEYVYINLDKNAAIRSDVPDCPRSIEIINDDYLEYLDEVIDCCEASDEYIELVEFYTKCEDDFIELREELYECFFEEEDDEDVICPHNYIVAGAECDDNICTYLDGDKDKIDNKIIELIF